MAHRYGYDLSTAMPPRKRRKLRDKIRAAGFKTSRYDFDSLEEVNEEIAKIVAASGVTQDHIVTDIADKWEKIK